MTAIFHAKAALFSKPKRPRVAPKADRTSEGIVFDSRAEMKRWQELTLLQKAGQISGLERQRVFVLAFGGRPVSIRSARYPNGRECRYTADFIYRDERIGKVIVEEYKAVDTDAHRLRRAVCEAIYGIEITVTGPAASKTPRRPA